MDLCVFLKQHVAQAATDTYVAFDPPAAVHNAAMINAHVAPQLVALEPLVKVQARGTNAYARKIPWLHVDATIVTQP